MYDVTAGNVETPLGMGKFVEYIPHRGVVVVKMDNNYLMEFDAKEVYINAESVRN
jgi:hypothetical protein